MTFLNNYGGSGGGFYVDFTNSCKSCLIEDVIFKNNTMNIDAGAIHLFESRGFVINNCFFEDNTALINAGAV